MLMGRQSVSTVTTLNTRTAARPMGITARIGSMMACSLALARGMDLAGAVGDTGVDMATDADMDTAMVAVVTATDVADMATDVADMATDVADMATAVAVVIPTVAVVVTVR